MTTATTAVKIARNDLRLDDPEGALPILPSDCPDFEGYHIPDFFDDSGCYLGPDDFGVRVLHFTGRSERALEAGEQVVIIDYCDYGDHYPGHDEPVVATLMRRDANGDVWRYCDDCAEATRKNCLADGVAPPVLRSVLD